MRPASGQHTCECCQDLGYQEFKKIVELKDAGVTIYRYSPQIQDEAHIGTETGEVFILRNTGDEDLKIEELNAESGMKTISCPRCMKMIDRAKMLFKNLPPDKIREVTGVCEHCYQKQLFHCPCCDKIVGKFLKFCREEEQQKEDKRKRNKSWLTKTQVSLKKSFTHIKDAKLEPCTKLTGRIEEPQAHVSRYIPTTKPVQEPSPSEFHKTQVKSESGLTYEQKKHRLAEEVLEKPLRVLSFLDFSQEEKPTIKGVSEIDKEKKKRLTGKNIEKPFKSVSFHAFSERDFTPTLEEEEEALVKPTPTVEKQIKSTPIMGNNIKPLPTVDKDIKTTPTVKEDILPKRTVEKISKPSSMKEKDSKLKTMLEKDSKPTSIIEKDMKPKLFTEKDIRPKSIMKKGGVLKSEKDGVPKDNITPRGKTKRSVSPTTQHSFETVMKSLSEPNVSVFSYTFPHEKIVTKKQMKGAVSSSELIKNTQDMLDERKEMERKKKEERKKQEEEKKQRIAEQKRIIAEEKRKQEEERISKEETRKQEKERISKEEKRKGEEERDIKYGEGTAEEIDQKRKRKKTDDIGATTALKEGLAKQAKELAAEEKNRKQKERDTEFGEKKAREAEKAIEDTRHQLTTDRKTKHPEAKSGSDTGLQKGEKIQKVDQDYDKVKERDEKQRDVGAQAALKEQVAKQAKEKSEEEKLRKQQEKDVALGEKKAQEAEKALEATQKQLTAENKTKQKSETEVKSGDKTDGAKGDTGKGEKLDKTDKEQKVKDTKHDEMAALLREQLAKQKQQELEKEKIRKQQEKEKELAEKRLKELESKKKAEEAAIKKPVLEPEHEDSVDENITEVILKSEEVTDIIIGQKIYRVKSAKKSDDKTPIIALTQPQKPKQNSGQETAKQEPELQNKSELSSAKPLQGSTEQKSVQPTAESTQEKRAAIGEKKSKMNVYRMRPAKPQFDWFEHNKNKREMTYDSGEKLAEFDDNGRGRWYYRSGELALDYYDAEETNAGQRFVVYSTGQPDDRGRSRPRTLLATFDYSGNGIVFDHTGKIRLKYNQTEGVVLDRTIGPVSHWKWHTLNDPPVLQQVMIDTQMPYKDPTILGLGDKNADAKRPDNEEMLAIEFENFLKEKRQKLTQSFKPFQIKMKAMKINEYFSLRVLDQASIYLLFRDGTTNLKLNIGMVLDHKEIVDTDTAEIGEVSNTLDKLPACTDSIAGLQKAVAKAQTQERSRVRHELRLKRPEVTASVDALRAGCSRPLRTPVVQASLSSCDKMTTKRFKPSCCNLYYSTQIL